MKPIMKALITVGAVALLALPCMASAPEITVKVDGERIVFPDQPPIIENDRTLVPVRFVAEALDYSVEWDADDRSVSIDDGKIVLNIDSNQAEIDGAPTTLDVAPRIINDRTMIPLRVVAETLDCTVDWFGTNRMILVNRRDSDGSELSLFERYRQSELFYEYSTPDAIYLTPKSNHSSYEEAISPDTYRDFQIKLNRDKSKLVNQSLDCSIKMRAFDAESLALLRDLLNAPYPTGSAEAYDLALKAIKGELWETFYREDSRYYPTFAAVAPRSGTFGTHYLDNREVEVYVRRNCTEFGMNLSSEGYVNPEVPRELSQEEIDAKTQIAKQSYYLGLWGLN